MSSKKEQMPPKYLSLLCFSLTCHRPYKNHLIQYADTTHSPNLYYMPYFALTELRRTGRLWAPN